MCSALLLSYPGLSCSNANTTPTGLVISGQALLNRSNSSKATSLMGTDTPTSFAA